MDSLPVKIINESDWWLPWLPVLGSFLVALVALAVGLASNSTNRAAIAVAKSSSDEAIAAAERREHNQWRGERIADYVLDFHEQLDEVADLLERAEGSPKSLINWNGDTPTSSFEPLQYIDEIFEALERPIAELATCERKLSLVATTEMRTITSNILNRARDFRWDACQPLYRAIGVEVRASKQGLPDFVQIDAELLETRRSARAHLTEIKQLGDDLLDAARGDITNGVVPVSDQLSRPSVPNMEAPKCKPKLPRQRFRRTTSLHQPDNQLPK